MIQKNLPDDEPVIELGASIGVVSCTVNRRLAAPAQHVVVEANPELIPTLKKNRDMNRCQFAIVEAAIGYGNDSIPFFSNGMSLAGSIYGKGQTMEVPAKTLQAIAEDEARKQIALLKDKNATNAAVVVIALGVDVTQALVMSQVVLSFVLPVPIIALIIFTSRSKVMGPLANTVCVTTAAVAAGIVILTLNVILVWTALGLALPR